MSSYATVSSPRTRDRIVAACSTLLRDGGPDAASTRAICAAAGVKAPTLYHHFGDVAALYAVAVDQAFAESARRKTGASAEPMARLRAGWDAYVRFAQEEPGLFSAMSRQIVSGVLPGVAVRSYESLTATVRALGAERRLRHPPELAAQMLWGAAHGAACLMFAGPHGFALAEGLSAALREATIGSLIVTEPD